MSSYSDGNEQKIPVEQPLPRHPLGGRDEPQVEGHFCALTKKQKKTSQIILAQISGHDKELPSSEKEGTIPSQVLCWTLMHSIVL